MPAPRQVVRDAAEADNALNAFLNAPPLAPSLGTPAPAPIVEPAPAPVAQDPQPAPAPAPVAVPTTTDAELQRVMQQMRTLQGQFATQQAELERLRAQPAPAPAAPAPVVPAKIELLSDAERTEYGEPFIDLVKRAAREAIEPVIQSVLGRVESLESGVSATKQIAQKATAHIAQSAEDAFWQKLDTSVPDHEQINVDPRFIAWLQQVPEFGNHSLQQILQAAAGNLNAERVISIFQAYKRATNPQPAPTPAPNTPAPTDPIASLVSPSSVAPAQVVPNEVGGKIWTGADIDKAFDDIRKKRVDPATAARLDAEITLALAEGRVRG